MDEQPWQDSGHRVFAALYGWMSPALESGPVGTARRALLADARGVVVDLASRRRSQPAPSGSRGHARASGRARSTHAPSPRDAPAQVHRAGAEQLPLPTAGVDTVLATLTLCTAQDPRAAAEEIRRVLRPGGRLLILEHVRAADPHLARWQDRTAGIWSHFGGGCRLNRDTVGLLTHAGFDIGTLRHFSVPGRPLTSAWVTGWLAPGAAPVGDGLRGRDEQ